MMLLGEIHSKKVDQFILLIKLRSFMSSATKIHSTGTSNTASRVTANPG